MADPLESELRRISEIPYHANPPFKTLWMLFKGQRWRLAVAMVAFAIKQAPVWVMPIIFANLINLAIAGGPHVQRDILLNVAVMLVVLGQNIPVHALYTYLLSKAIREVQLHVRAALIAKLQHFSMSYYLRFHGGRLHAKMLRDVEVIQMLGKTGYDTIFNSICSTVAAIIIIVAKGQPAVLFFFLLGTPLAVILMRIFQKPMVKANHDFRNGLESISAQITEMVDMVPVTRAHALEESESMRMREKLDSVRHTSTRLDIISELFGSCSWVSFNIFSFACVLFTVGLVLRHKLPAGDIVMYQQLFSTVIGTISTATMIYPQFATGLESLKSIGEVLEVSDVEEHRGRQRVSEVAGQFRMEGVSFRHEDAEDWTIRDFSLDVQPGECVAIVGESGAGKSTLMSLVIGFHCPTEGVIYLDGKEMRTLDLRDYRKHLAVVPQQIQLFSGTIRDNITYGLKGVSEAALQQALETANVQEFLPRLAKGVDTVIGPHGATLSGGQRQRLAIARAVIRNPRVIILDEATSGLDVVSEQLVQQAINRLIRGRTTFIVAHRLSTIRHADKVVVLDRGRLIECGSQEELLAQNGVFTRLKALQI